MSDGETMTREQELAEEFKEGLSKDDVPQLAQRIAALEANRDAERARADAEQGRADRAEKARDRAKAKVTAAPAAVKPRKLGDIGKDRVDGSIADAIADADRVEIAFSDGDNELEAVDAVVVEGDAWRATPNGHMLAEPVMLQGPGLGDPAVQICGYALLLDGKQVAYRERPDPITLVPGQTYKIENDIIF